MIEPSSRQLVQVWWTDATNVAGGWHDAEDLDRFATDGAWEASNTGWLVYEDEKSIVLASRMTDDGRNVGLVERIPKAAITSMNVHAEKSPDPAAPNTAGNLEVPAGAAHHFRTPWSPSPEHGRGGFLMEVATVGINLMDLPEVGAHFADAAGLIQRQRALLQAWEPRVRCPQCGGKYTDSPCGPSHAEIAALVAEAP